MLKSLALAFSCFSRIPMPRVEWSRGNMRFMMACFPLVGAAVGLLLAAWWWACEAAGFGAVLRAVGVVLVPVAVSGGIHLDGFADVVDALASHADAGRKREILKDPHIGAFAAIGVAAWLLAYMGFATELSDGWSVAAVLACIAVLVRCESGFAAMAFPGAGEGMLASFRSSAEKRVSLVVLVVEFVAAGAAAIVIAPVPGIAVLVVGLVCLVALRPFAARAFGGMSGDVAGFFLCVCELAMVAALVVAAKAVAL